MSVTAPNGFIASGVAAGIKASGAQDVALVVNSGPEDVVAAVFTSNRFAAAPVLWSQQVVADGSARAVVVNSGGANACTGPEGFADTHRTAEFVAESLQQNGFDIGSGDVVVCSTGLIGERLPMDLLLSGVEAAAASLAAESATAALAIMTTDSVPKVTQVEADEFTIGGMAKGAGMLAPGLATMIVVLTTDASLSAEAAARSLALASRMTFDRIDSDGCMSTNDTVVLMANGASGRQVSEKEFTNHLTEACADLARQLITDAEGASKEICVSVRGAHTENEALDVARSIARSNLLKCAIHGEDPNWGRVLSAIGTTAAAFHPDQVDVAINGVWVCRRGSVGESRDLVSMTAREVVIDVELRAGDSSADIWTNDLTADYVHENSAYSS